MTANKIIEEIAIINGIPVDAITSHSYNSNYSWHRISQAKKQASYLLSHKYTYQQIANLLGYSTVSTVAKNIAEIKKKIQLLNNRKAVEMLISLLQE